MIRKNLIIFGDHGPQSFQSKFWEFINTNVLMSPIAHILIIRDHCVHQFNKVIIIIPLRLL